MPNFVEIQCHLLGYQNRTNFHCLQNAYQSIVLVKFTTTFFYSYCQDLFHGTHLCAIYSMPKFVRLIVIFLVRKISTKVHGGWLPPPSNLPLSNLEPRNGSRSDLIFFLNRCPKDETTDKIGFGKNSSSLSRENF